MVIQPPKPPTPPTGPDGTPIEPGDFDARYVKKSGDIMTGGLSFGGAVASDGNDTSKHITFTHDADVVDPGDLTKGTYLYKGKDYLGFGVSSKTLNIVAKNSDDKVITRIGGEAITSVGNGGLEILGDNALFVKGQNTDERYIKTTGGKVTGELEVEGSLHIHGDGDVDTPKLIIKDQDSDERYLLRTEYVPPVGSVSSATVGDVKSGFQAADHSGWIILNGRGVETLTESQQVAAQSLGFANNIPDATGSVLMQSGALGAVVGSNERVLTQSNLPAVTLTSAAASGSSGPAGGHNHVFQSNINDQGVQNFNELLAGFGGNEPGSVYPAIKWRGSATIANTANNGTIINGYACDGAQDHTHTFGDHAHEVPLGGSATPLDITPKSMAVNQFVYLGA